MAYNDVVCTTALGNTGLANCTNNLDYDARLIFTTDSFEFANEAAAIVEANWTDAIDAGTVFPMPLFEEIEPAIEDDVEQETAIGLSLFVREGKYGGIGRFQTALCNLPKLRTFNEVLGRAFIVTGNGQVWGTSPDGTKFKGFKLSKFHVSGLKGSDGSTVRMVELRYQLKNPNEMADYPAVPTLTWDPLELSGVIDVDVTEVGTSTSGSVVAKVLRDCDGEIVTGLVEGDFTILASDGTTQMLPSDGFTDNADGTYTFLFTTPVLPADTYTFNLKTPTAQTTGGYESTASFSFTIT